MFEGHHRSGYLSPKFLLFWITKACLSQSNKVHSFHQVVFSYSFLWTLVVAQASCPFGLPCSPLFLVLGSCTILCWISPPLPKPLLTVPLINFFQLHHLGTPSLAYQDTDQVCRLFTLLSSCPALPPTNRNQTPRF